MGRSRTSSTSETNRASSPDAAHIAAATETFVTRVPILTNKGDLYAYEILGQSAADNVLEANPTVAARCLLHTVLNVIGLTELVAEQRLMVTVSATNLIEEDYLVLPADRTILHLEPKTLLTDQTRALCAAVKQAGYTMALSAAHASDNAEDIIGLANILRVDIRTITTPAVQTLLTKARSKGVRILADNVDSPEANDAAQQHGAELKRGTHFCEPDVRAGKSLTGVRSFQLQFLAALNQTPMDLERVEKAITCDAALTHNLLKYLNSAAMGMREKITSVRHAMRLLGEKPLRKWGSLVALHALTNEKPHELLVTALVRAHFCEQVAGANGMASDSLEFHLAGLLSVIHALLDVSMPKAVESLPLEQRVREALLGSVNSPVGCALSLAHACEQGAWSTATSLAAKLRLTQRDVASRYYESLSWATRTLNQAA